MFTKRISAILCAFALLFMLPACGVKDPSEAITAETEPEMIIETTTRPETTTEPPFYSFAPIPDEESPGQSHEPLRGGEMAIEWACVNDIVGRFGAYESYTTERDVNGGQVQLNYADLTVEIAYGYSPPVSFDYGEDYWPFREGADVPLAKADKALIGQVSRLFWTDRDIDLPAPRGLKIGDSEADVLRSYLDLRTKYKDTDLDNPWRTRAIYGREDSIARSDPNGFSSEGWYRIYPGDEYPPPVPCDYTIVYFCSDMSFMLEGTEYCIKDSKVVAIDQSCHGGC